MKITYRPISTWPGERTRARRASPFRAHWSDTSDLLERELRLLGVREALLELGLDEFQISVVTGLPKAKSRQPDDPGIILSFDSHHGPLRYATDAFTKWQDNVRAVALGLEALRKVDRYGISTRGEQYSGWLAIEATSASAEDSRTFLREWLDQHSPVPFAEIWAFDDRALARQAKRYSHPDSLTGEDAAFRGVIDAIEKLGVS